MVNSTSLILLLLVFLLSALPIHSTVPDDKFLLREGHIFRVSESTMIDLNISGYVRNLYQAGPEIYYLKTESLSDMKYSAGYKNIDSGFSAEMAVNIDMPGRIIKRFAGSLGAAYLLSSDTSSLNSGTLYRIDLNAGNSNNLPDVIDFQLSGNTPVILKEENRNIFLNVNGDIINLAISGSPRITEIVGGRIAFISNGEETEIADILVLKNIYGYPPKGKYKRPEGRNLIIEAVDDTNIPDQGKMIFYRLIIDGIEAGRTDTGPSQLPLIISADVRQDCQHIIQLERWELNKVKSKYERVNNINQPGALRLFSPADRIIKIRITHDGKSYFFLRSTAAAQ
jgi:hypothetical protein